MIRLVVFDCDGTLVDSQHVIREAMTRAFAANGLPAPQPAAVRRVIGLSLAVAVERLWPEGDADGRDVVVDAYRDAFLDLGSRPDHHEPLFPGAAEAVEALGAAGYVLGVATGKGKRGLRATLGRVGLLERFATLQTADDAPSKPHPGMLLRAMAETGAHESGTVFVGDTTFDMQMAVNARVTPLGVGWGYHGARELRAAGAHAVVERFAELVGAIDQLWPRAR